MKPKISVIIPVYNSELYISECIDSLQHQSLNDIEIILINDGSSDDSGKICRAYANTDKRIKLIEQENRGVCEARNAGLNSACGEFVAFVDSDDWMHERGLELLLAAYENTGADLIVANMGFVDGSKIRTIRVFDKPFTSTDREWINKYQVACIGYGYNPNPGTKFNITGLGSMGNKLFKREILELNALRFDPYTLGIYEDNLFVLHYLEQCEKISYIDDTIYYYRKVSDSNSRGYKQNTLEINKRIFELINDFILKYKQNFYDDYYKALNIYIIRRLQASLSVYFFAKQNKNYFHNRLRKLNELIRSEPYNEAIKNVDQKLLNPKNHKITWATAKTNSAFIMYCGFKLRMILIEIIRLFK